MPRGWITIGEKDNDMTMFLEPLISNSFFYDTHSLPDVLKDSVQVRSSSVSVFKSKRKHTHNTSSYVLKQ